MSLVATTVSVLAISGALLLVWSGTAHLVHFGRLRASLSAQGILPFRWQRTAGRMLVGVEIGVGAAALISLVTGARPGLAALALVYAGLGVYVGVLLLLGRRAPCGCFDSDEPVSVYVVLRCLIFAVAAAAAIVVHPSTPDAGPSLLLIPAAVVFALLARALPALYRREA